jgi:hypothetical protein
MQMGLVLDILNDIRGQIAVDDAVLKEAKDRRNLVVKAALGIDGARGSFRSGSVAHGTVNAPVTDADAGIVLDRRTYPKLGPDGEGEGPEELVDDLCELIGPIVREDYPDAKMHRSRRGVFVTFASPLGDDQDPTVDLIPTLDRKDADGLWIPDLDNNDWSPSHPEKHTDLLTSGSKELRAFRARIARLAKAWNKQWAKNDRALSSFNIEALVWEYVDDDALALGLDGALAGWFAYARDELDKGRTKDPAGVSDDIKLLLTKDTVLQRLGGAADRLDEALKADADGDEDKVRDLLSGVFRNYVDAPAESKSALAAALRGGNEGIGATTSGIAIAAATRLKTTRSFGDERNG